MAGQQTFNSVTHATEAEEDREGAGGCQERSGTPHQNTLKLMESPVPNAAGSEMYCTWISNVYLVVKYMAVSGWTGTQIRTAAGSQWGCVHRTVGISCEFMNHMAMQGNASVLFLFDCMWQEWARIAEGFLKPIFWHAKFHLCLEAIRLCNKY